ncbi:hypothetical protein, partial [Massilia timonae]|uniref:hypothetical protein n=1 Tax=Massilia timonae TaxID=47229 RepID=UPI0028A24945
VYLTGFVYIGLRFYTAWAKSGHPADSENGPQAHVRRPFLMWCMPLKVAELYHLLEYVRGLECHVASHVLLVLYGSASFG